MSDATELSGDLGLLREGVFVDFRLRFAQYDFDFLIEFAERELNHFVNKFIKIIDIVQCFKTLG
jgi:hypothetical protein